MSILDNKYRFLSLISKNEVTSVFLGEYIPTGQYIIIKISIPGQEKIAAARFEKEYNILKSLDHPNIVKVLDFSNSYPYLVFEYIQGANALQKYKDNSVPLDESYAVLHFSFMILSNTCIKIVLYTETLNLQILL